MSHDGKETVGIDSKVADDLEPWHFKRVQMDQFDEQILTETKCVMGSKAKGIPADSKEVKAKKMVRRRKLQEMKGGLGFHLLRACKHSKQSTAVATMLWMGYLLHTLGCHVLCIDDEHGLSSLGRSRCAKERKPAKISKLKDFKFLQEYICGDSLLSSFPRLVHFVGTFPNESCHAVSILYKDKNVHYKNYNIPYWQTYLDWNENRLRGTRYTYQTQMRDWKIAHRHRHNRTVQQHKTYMWQEEALARVFPEHAGWFVSEDAPSIELRWLQQWRDRVQQRTAEQMKKESVKREAEEGIGADAKRRRSDDDFGVL